MTVLGGGSSSSSSNGGNSHEADEELIQYFHKNAMDMDDLQKNSQLSELRKLLQINLPSGLARAGPPGAVHRGEGDVLEQDGVGGGSIRRRVSFQPSLESGEALALVGGQTVGSVPPSPNTRRAQFNFTPIGTCLEQVQGVSQCSSANASPFMSPRNTPLPRSRHNSGQMSSTYVTPRSTPFTPDQPGGGHPVPSESSTPFMSPIPTPIPRSRHNSSQNLRTIYTPTCRSRHSSGAPSLRHAPYAAEDPSGRRGGKFSSRHSSGSVPPSPSSAPLSPLVQDSSLHQQQDMCGLQLGGSSMLQLMLKNKPVSSGPRPGMSDLRRRHMSAGPTIPYQSQPQPPTFHSDPLAQEVTSVLTNPQPGPSGAQQANQTNRPQSVPLLQMLNMQDTFAKSQPNTPLVGQPFSFSDCSGMSQASSYAPTPVPSEYNDFTETYNLDIIDPLLEVNMQGDASSSGVLDPLDSLSLPGTQPTDLSTLSDPLQVPPNINPFETFQGDSMGMREPLEDRVGVACCMDPLRDPQDVVGGEGRDMQEPLINPSSMLTLNALNRPSLEVVVGGGAGLEDDFQPTLADLGDQEVFNSLVRDVNKD